MADLESTLADALGTAYRLERELGGGGMSRVFVAEEVALGRRVVVKVLPPEMTASVNAERFRREIRMAAQLQHPAIVPLLSAGATSDLLWYVMPFVEGASLRTRLARGAMPLDEAVRAWRDLLEALEYAHEHNVVHRDIKPENIMLAGRHAVVLDFGVGKAVSASTGVTAMGMTGLGMAIGTPAYMAPEQVAGEANADGRLDLYAAGLVMYEMLTGRKPFDASTASEIMAAHVAQPPQPLSLHRAEVPPGLEQLVMQCLAKSPAQRPATAAAVLQTLDGLSGEISNARTPQSGTTQGAAARTITTPPSAPRSRVPLVVGALAVLATVIGGAVYLQRDDRAGAPVAVEEVADTARVTVAFVPAVHDPADSVLARTLSNTLLGELQKDRRLRPLGDEAIESMAVEIGLATRPLVRDTVAAIGRDLGMHITLAPSVARVGSGFLLSAEARSLLGDSLLVRSEVAANDAAAVPAALRTVATQVAAAIGGAFGKINRAQASGRFFNTTPLAARLWTEALGAFFAGDYYTSAEKARQAVADDSTFAGGWGILSTSLQNLGIRQQEQFEALRNAYRYRERVRSPWGRSLNESAWLRRIGDFDGALRAARSGGTPNRVLGTGQTENEIALSYSGMRRPELAREYYGRGRDTTFRAPNVINRNYQLLLLETGRVDEARRELARYDSLVAPGNVNLSRMHSEFELATGNIAGAVQRSAQRVTTAPSAAARYAASLNLRTALAAAGRLDSARAVERRIRETLAQGGDTASIITSLANEAVVLSDILGDTTASRALDAPLTDGRWGATAVLDRPYPVMIAALASAGRTAEARRLLDEWQRGVPRELARVEGWRMATARGEILLAERKPAEALAAFRAGDSTTCIACAWPQYARAYDAMGKRDSAILWYEQYVTRTSVTLANNAHPRLLARAYRRLGELHEDAGHTKEALQRYSDFVELWKNADPTLQGAVQSAKARITALQGKR